MAREGFAAFRQAWGLQLSFESWRDLLRYVFLLERVERWPAPARLSDPGCAPRVLVIAFGHFGDMLHLAPMLRRVKAQRPQAVVHVLAGPWSAGTLERLGLADRVINYAPHMALYHRGHSRACPSRAAERRLLEGLRAKEYELAISVGKVSNLPDFVALRAARAAITIAPWPACDLYPRWPGWRSPGPSVSAYEADRLMHLLRDAGLEPAPAELSYTVPVEARTRAAMLLREAGVHERGRYAVLAPGAGWPGKQWPADRFAVLAHWLMDEGMEAVLMAGAAEEHAVCAAAAGAARAGLVNLAGKTSWDELGAILAGAAVFVGNDSGPLHLAAAMGAPTVCVFGPTEPERWAPRGARHRCVRGGTGCAGCHPWHIRARCLHDGACPKAVSVAQVQTAIRAVWRMEAAA